MAPVIAKKATKTQPRVHNKTTYKFVVDCKAPVDDGILKTQSFEAINKYDAIFVGIVGAASDAEINCPPICFLEKEFKMYQTSSQKDVNQVISCPMNAIYISQTKIPKFLKLMAIMNRKCQL
uniref:60S ribosomal protein L23a n=1 Tax=Rhabditophanes sp. KR3021 TaxID=114890 RepID=A0AC35TXJ6_9BILA